MPNGAVHPDLRQKLIELKQFNLAESSQKILQRSSKAQRQESFKHALVELNNCFEDYLAHVISLRFDLHAGQTKKLRFKKDRIKILSQHNIDYLAIDGAETAQVLAWIAQSIIYEDSVVTPDLHDAFPFWKEGYPMVQLDNTYKILIEDIQLHYAALIDVLLAV